MDRSEDFARACAVPKDVTIGGRTFHVAKVSPRALGEVQRWMMSVLVDPREAARDTLRAAPDMPEEEARAVWVAAALEAMDWPPELGSDVGNTLMMTPEGRARLLFAVSRQHDPALTLDLCRGAAEVMTGEEFEALQAAISPRELGDVIDPDSSSAGVPYTEVRAALAERYGWTFAHIDGLSFEQIRLAWTGGKMAHGVPVTDAADAASVHERWREFVYGL